MHETSLLSQAVLKHVSGVQRFHLQEVYAREQLVLYPARMKKSMALLFHIKKIFMSCYITFKRKLQHVGHKWIIYGSHLDCSVGQMGQQV